MNRQTREQIWSSLSQPWDIIIVGGGVTGAGILHEAARRDLRVLLLEQQDFAWGTSSRSSKLVHGGLRYLRQGQIGLTRASVQERQQLLQEAPGLVEPLGFLWATYEGDSPGRWVLEAGLSLYDLLARQWEHRFYETGDFTMLAPHLDEEQLRGGFSYGDAQTDDARLVLRLLQEAVAAAPERLVALNYARAETLLWEIAENGSQRVAGVRVRDLGPAGRERVVDVQARLVVNATGAWADHLRNQVVEADKGNRIRPLRGSHLIFPAWRLPVAQAISFPHPLDGRPVFIFPWEGVTLVGTTDVDHGHSLEEEPRISPEEVAYLMAAVDAHFSSRDLGLEDVISSFAGVRPVVNSGAADPSQESRDRVIWADNGLLTVTGGKLTTFRRTAQEVLAEAGRLWSEMPPAPEEGPALAPIGGPLPGEGRLSEESCRRLWGRYGREAPALVSTVSPESLSPIPNTPYLYAELEWAARNEAVVHLDDLLLRRTRLGLLLRDGGAAHHDRLRAICQPALGWNDQHWQREWHRYCRLWHDHYSLPPAATIPNWRRDLQTVEETPEPPPWLSFRRLGPPGVLISLGLLGAYLFWQRR